jgi:hypothetical protein
MAINQTQAQNDLEIAIMRMNQVRDLLCDAIAAGDETKMARLEKVQAAAISDYKSLRAELAA